MLSLIPCKQPTQLMTQSIGDVPNDATSVHRDGCVEKRFDRRSLIGTYLASDWKGPLSLHGKSHCGI